MWISNKIAIGENNNKTIETGEVTEVSNNTVYVQSNEEHREINIVAPYGIAYVPIQGEKAVVLPMGDASVCAGVIMPDKSLQEGEIMLFSSGGATIELKNNGQVLINGNVVGQ